MMISINMEEKIKCGFWNILADGLGNGEFMTDGGDKICIEWETRKHRVMNVLCSMMEICDIIVTVENDHFHWILNELQKNNPYIDGIYYIESSSFSDISAARKFRKINPECSFLTECGIYSSDYSRIYESSIKDPYTSDDGIGIYYKKDIVNFISADKPKINNSDMYICRGNEQYIIAKFQMICTSNEINICGAHLSSGEEETKEKNRIHKLMDIFEKMRKMNNSIIMMDSNCSLKYETNYVGKTCNRIIDQNEYYDLVKDKGNECFKMRHAHGGQVTKYGQLMFDTIDKILIKKEMHGKQIDHNFCFTKYPKFMFKLINEWRTNAEKRKILFKYSANVNNFKNCNDYEPLKIYDKNNKFLFEMDGNKQNRWSANINNNDATGFNKLSSDPTEIFKYLYPNIDAPSDHPPIAVIIYL